MMKIRFRLDIALVIKRFPICLARTKLLFPYKPLLLHELVLYGS